MDDQYREMADEADTPPEVLASLAHEFPELRARIAVHPNAYPGLLEWLAEYGDAGVRSALASRGWAPPESETLTGS
jgi:hypothetical protein